MSWLYLPALLLAAVYALYWYCTRTFDYWKKKNVPYIPPVPLFGNLLDSTLRRKYMGEVMSDLYNYFPNEKFVGIFRMTTPCLLVRDLDLIKHVMIKDFDQFLDRGMELSKEGLGANLFHADGDTWQMLRNKFTPLFTSGKLKNMTYLIANGAHRFGDHVTTLVRDNPEQEVHKLLQKYTLATISACAFGIDVELGEAQLALLKSFDEGIFSASLFLELDMMYPGILKSLNLPLFSATIINFFSSLVKNVIKERNGIPSGRKDFMDLILELMQKGLVVGTRRTDEKEELQLEITEDVIAAQAFVFYIAGYETSATTMTFMLYELARNPDVQEKVIAEVDEIFKKHNGEITYESLKDLTYMEQVFNETLRLYPIVDILQRNAVNDYRIPGTDVVVKKRQTVIVSPFGIHHNPKYFPEPEKFDPERFSTENFSNLHPCAYIPFGIGPRNCIGMRFAKVQSRACMMKFFSKFRVEASKNTPTKVKFDPNRALIGPDGGLYLNIVPRK